MSEKFFAQSIPMSISR